MMGDDGHECTETELKAYRTLPQVDQFCRGALCPRCWYESFVYLEILDYSSQIFCSDFPWIFQIAQKCQVSKLLSSGMCWFRLGFLHRFCCMLEFSGQGGTAGDRDIPCLHLGWMSPSHPHGIPMSLSQVGPVLATCNGAFGMTSAALPLIFKLLLLGCSS